MIVVVEFYGIPRQRAGMAELAVEADSISAVLIAVRTRCPGLADLLTNTGQLSSHYLLSLDGTAFVGELMRPLSSGSRLLLLSADAGG